MRFFIPPLSGGLDLKSSNSGCACLGSGVAPLSGWLKKKLPSCSPSSVGIAAPLAPRCAGPWMMRSRARLRRDAIFTPRKRRTRAPVLTGGPGAAPGGVASKNVYSRGICAYREGPFPMAHDACVCVCR